MPSTHLFVSALCIGTGIAAIPRAVSSTNGEAILTTLQTLQSDVQTYGAIAKENVAHTGILNQNTTAITTIQGALSNIVDSIAKTSQTIQSFPANMRQISRDATDPGTAILAVVSGIATELIGLFLSLIGTITACKILPPRFKAKSWQDITNSLLEGFTELTTILGSLVDNIPSFQAISSFFSSALNGLPL